jgi:cytosine/adenosine deaminase-related metal-dependent hydrolase
MSPEASRPPRTVVRAGWILTHDGSDHVLLRDGCVVWHGSRIEYVGQDYTGPYDEELDASGGFVMPGLIDLDALADIDHALLDTWVDADTARGYEWSTSYLESGPQAVLTPEERRLMREFALRQLLLHGVTTAMPIAAEVHTAWAETAEEIEEVAELAELLGLRMYLGPSYRAGVNVISPEGVRDVAWRHDAGRDGLEGAVRSAHAVAARRSPLVRPALLPCRIETMTPELLRGTAEAAAELRCPVRIHALQDPVEVRMIQDRYATDPLELLDRVGLLGPSLLIPHALHLGGHRPTPQRVEADLDRLAAARTTVVHCPLTSARGGEALRTVDSYLAAGVRLALGTDSFPPDLIRGMATGNLLAKVLSGDPGAGSPAAYVRAATTGGADALNRPDLGRLVPGATADLIVVDLTDRRTGVVDDPVHTMLLNCTGRDVRTSVVHGRVVVRDGRVVAPPSRTDLAGQAQRLFERMRGAYQGRDWLGRDPDTLFPSSFPVAARDDGLAEVSR